MEAKELLDRYTAGERDFRGVDLVEANLAGVFLAGANLDGVNLSKANLSKANLAGATSRAQISLMQTY